MLGTFASCLGRSDCCSVKLSIYYSLRVLHRVRLRVALDGASSNAPKRLAQSDS